VDDDGEAISMRLLPRTVKRGVHSFFTIVRENDLYFSDQTKEAS
jgi:hypothetical protein